MNDNYVGVQFNNNIDFIYWKMRFQYIIIFIASNITICCDIIFLAISIPNLWYNKLIHFTTTQIPERILYNISTISNWKIYISIYKVICFKNNFAFLLSKLYLDKKNGLPDSTVVRRVLSQYSLQNVGVAPLTGLDILFSLWFGWQHLAFFLVFFFCGKC